MSTRTSLYKRYREQIKSMSDEDFGDAKAISSLEEDIKNACSGKMVVKHTPYELYRNRKLKFWSLRIAASLIIVVAMFVWLACIKGRL